MLRLDEVKRFIDEDRSSKKKKAARIGLKYYESEHDIKDYRVYYYDADGNLKEDKNKSNVKIPHSFFTELIDQKVQYMLSGKDGFIRSDIPELQAHLDTYFDDDFKAEVADLLTYGGAEGFSYFYAYKNAEDRTAFSFADGLGIIECESKYTSDGKNYVIYYYPDKIIDTVGDNKDKNITRIQVWDDQYTYYLVEIDGTIMEDKTQVLNPRPHVIYKMNDKFYFDTFGYIPFFRFDNNKNQSSDLKPIKELIDDYDLMSCGLSNNLVDLSEGYFVVKGFEGDNLDELTTSLKTKKHIGVPTDGDLEIRTVNIPYDARKTKMELDETNIYRFGMGFNSAQLGDGNVTNVVIKSRYALLDLKCNKTETNLRRFLKKIIKIVLDEINATEGTGYSLKDIYFDFEREIITNATDNATIAQTEANTENIRINTLLSLVTKFGDELILEQICDVLDLDWEMVKDKLPTDERTDLNKASEDLLNIPVEDEEEDTEETEETENTETEDTETV